MPSPGLEPGRRNRREILSLLCLPFHQEGNITYGDHGRTRTLNLLIRSQLLYPVELRDRHKLYLYWSLHSYCIHFFDDTVNIFFS